MTTRLTYRSDKQRVRARLASVHSATIKTEWGTVQYVDEGDGPPVLLSHGVLGGHDNAHGLVDLWIGEHFRAIAPSRFGYLGSEIAPDATVADQADTYAALVDHLQLDRVVLVGISAGGPAAIAFALRHPDRLHCLILGSSYLPGMGARTVPAVIHPLIRAVAGWELGWWLLKRFRPRLLARIMGVPKTWDPTGDVDFEKIRDALFPVSPKRWGVAFDAVVSEPASNTFPLEDIHVPTLLVHAADDHLAPYKHVQRAVERIPDARLVTIDAGGHLFLQHAPEVRAAMQNFIAEHLVGAEGGPVDFSPPGTATTSRGEATMIPSPGREYG